MANIPRRLGRFAAGLEGDGEDPTISNDSIADASIATGKLADDAVTNAKVADNAVDTAQLANGAVETAKINDDAVTNAKIANNAVQTAQINNDAVTQDKLADNSVGNAQMRDDSVGIAELSASGTPSSSTYLRGDNTWATVSGGGGGISGVNIQDEGTALNTAATTLNFTGEGVTASGTGATKTINIPGGSAGVDTRAEIEDLIGETDTLVTITSSTLVTSAISANGQFRLYDGDGTALAVNAALSTARRLEVRGTDARMRGVLARMSGSSTSGSLLKVLNGANVIIAQVTSVTTSGTGDAIVYTFNWSTGRLLQSNGNLQSGSSDIWLKPATLDLIRSSSLPQNSITMTQLNITNQGSGTAGQVLSLHEDNGGSGTWVDQPSGLQTFANNTAYTAGSYVFDTGVQHIYYVQADVPASNTTRPALLPLNFVDLGYLTKQQADAIYLNRPSLGENLVSDLSGATTIAARADATGTIRTNSFIDSTTAQIGFWPATYDFGNFPRSTDTFTARVSGTTWADLFNGDYTNIAMNFGSARSNGFLQTFYNGHVGNNVVEIALRRDATNFAIWQLNGGYFGSEGNVVYFGHTSPTLVNSQGSPADANLQLYISLTTAGAYSAISTKIAGENSFIGGDGIARQVGTAAIEDDAVTQAKIADDAVGADQLASNAVVNASITDNTITEAKMALNTPSNGDVLGYIGGDWRWETPTLGVYRDQWSKPNIGTGNSGTPIGGITASGQFVIASSVTNSQYNNVGNGEALSSITHIALNTTDNSGNDARLALGHLKNGSIIHIERNSDATQYAFLEITNNNPSNVISGFRQVMVLDSNGNASNTQDDLYNISIRPAPFMPTVTKDLADNIITTAKITDSAVTGMKLNITDPPTGTRVSENLYIDDDGTLHEAPYRLFDGTNEGIVPVAGTGDTRPDPDQLENVIQTQPLRITANTNGIIQGARGWQLIHNGTPVSVANRPTTWAGFDHSSDNVGIWITTEDLTQAERNRLTAFGTSIGTNAMELLAVNADDHNSWAIFSTRADLTESGDQTLETGDLGSGMYVSVGDGAFSVLSSQGIPSANLKFYFPTSLTAAVDISNTIPASERFIDAAGNWVEPSYRTLETLSQVLDTQISPYRLVGYDTSNAAVAYKQWDTKLDGHIYHFTVFYNFTNGVIQTAQVYYGHWTTAPTGDNATSFLFGTRTYTTTNGITTWSDSV